MKWTRDNYLVTTALSEFDMDFVVSSLQLQWRRGAGRERIEKAFEGSLSFGVFDRARQIGYVRAVTDRCFVSWICDLFLEPAYRGRGLGKWLMECVMSHPDLVHTRLVLSSVPKYQAFYERLGFSPMERGYSRIPNRPG